MDKEKLLIEEISNRLKSCKLGLIVKSVRHISPYNIITKLDYDGHLYVSIVGYESVEDNMPETLTVSNRIEDAVLWRSDPTKSGHILVFIIGEVDKLHSLSEFDVLTNRCLTEVLLSKYKEQQRDNKPTYTMLEYLEKNASHFAYEDIERFLQKSKEDWRLCGDHLWILNRLCDHELLSKSKLIEDRLDDNRELIDTLGILPDSTRQAIHRTISKFSDVQDIKDTYIKLSRYLNTVDKTDLKGLDYDKVKILLGMKKKEEEVSPIPTKNPTNPGNPSNPTSSTTKVKKPKDVKWSEFEEKVAEVIVGQEEEKLSLLADLFVSIQTELENGDNPIIISDGGELFDNRPIKLELSKGDFRTIIGQLCNDQSWGGKIVTKEPILRTTLSSMYDNKITTYNPYSDAGLNLLSVDGSSVVESLKSFDRLLSNDNSYKPLFPVFETLNNSRKNLIGVLDSIMYFPTITFGVGTENYDYLKQYIISWQELLKGLCNNEPLMREKSIQLTPVLLKCILSLDTLYVQTPSEWKSVLMPTHPLHLWKYYEIFRNLYEKRSAFGDKDMAELKKVLHDLPQTLNFVIIDKIVCQKDNIELPYSGNVEMLPAYENKTNRYLGKDGIECVKETILRWLEFAPFSKNELRLSVTDAPDVNSIVKDVSSILNDEHCQKVNIEFFYTRSKKEGYDFAICDYADSNEDIFKLLSNGRLQISSHNIDNKDEINEHLKKFPVHLAFFFDQLEYSIGYTHNKKSLYISPLVVTYDYHFDEVSKKGDIYPSSDMDSGMIGDYETLMFRANMVSMSDIPHPTLSQNSSIGHVTKTISEGQTQWLIVADRNISQYQPAESFPIGEKDYGRRLMSIWASNKSRVITNYVKMLRQYNLYPKQDNLVKILSEFGHISSEGLVTIPKVGSSVTDVEKKQKGLIGTVFAAYWYSKINEDSLVASLDDNDARLWLSNLDTSNERADLIGLTYNKKEDRLVIQPIEVKTWTSDSNEPVRTYVDPASKDTVIVGHAADQVAMTTKLIAAIFSNTDGSLNIFSAARKEALKYHIISECFRVNHDWKWQSDWSKILKRTFDGTSDIKIEIKGIVIYVDFQSSQSMVISECKNPNVEDVSMSYVKLGTDLIQEEILGSDDAPKEDKKDTSTKVVVIQFEKEDGHGINNNSNDILSDIPSLAAETLDHNTLTDDVLSTSTTDSSNNISSGLSVEEKEEIRKYITNFRRSCSVYGINLDYCDEVDDVVIGPSIIRVRFSLSRGQSLRPLQNHIEDISREMERTGVIIQPIKDSKQLNLDIPRKNRDIIKFSEVVGKLPEVSSLEQLFFTLGRTPNGEDIICNLADMPHMLVGGSTGSGKTVFLFTLLASLLKTHKTPKELQILLSSSGLEDFIMFNNLPHLIGGKVIDDAAEATELIRTTVIQEFDRRAEILTRAMAPNIIEYNKKAENKLPPIVIIIDEFADLADQLSTRQEKEDFFTPVKRIAQIGRKRGIHLVLCTQRPSATLVPSNIKSQITGRIALRVNDGNSSRMILEDSGDARFLLNHGDMIFKDSNRRERVQGYYMTTDELISLIQEIESFNN